MCEEATGKFTSGSLNLEDFVVVVPEGELEGEEGDYCLQNEPRPSLFYPSVVDQIPLGAAAISQVSSALDAGCSAKLVRCEDQPDVCSASERQKGFVVNKRLSFGSFDILDTDDLNEAGIQPPGQPQNGTASSSCDSILVQRLKLVSRENSAEDYLLLINPQAPSSSGSAEASKQSPLLTHRTSHDPSDVGTDVASSDADTNVASSSISGQGVTFDPASKPNVPDNVESNIARVSNSGLNPQAATFRPMTGEEFAGVITGVTDHTPPISNGTHSPALTNSQHSSQDGVEVGAGNRTAPHDHHSSNGVTPQDPFKSYSEPDLCVGAHVTAVRQELYSTPWHLDSTVEKDGLFHPVDSSTQPGTSPEKGGLLFEAQLGTSPERDGPSSTGSPTYNSSTSMERDSAQPCQNTGVSTTANRSRSLQESPAKVKDVVKFYETKKHPTLSHQRFGANSQSAGELRDRTWSGPPDPSQGASGSPSSFGRQDSRPLDRSRIDFFEQAQPKPGGETKSVYLKRKSTCNVFRAYSEPTQSDFLSADQLKEIHMSGTRSLPRSPQYSPHPATPQPTEDDSPTSESVNFAVTSGPPTEQEIMDCIEANCNDFINYTNWKVLLPHLMSKKLLDREISEILMSNYHTNRDKGLKYYLTVLPTKGKTAYSRFYSCVSEEEEHSGHRTLLELMDNFKKIL